MGRSRKKQPDSPKKAGKEEQRDTSVTGRDERLEKADPKMEEPGKTEPRREVPKKEASQKPEARSGEARSAGSEREEPKTSERRSRRKQPDEHREGKRDGGKGSDSMSDQEIRRYILFLSVPLVAILVIVVFLASGNLKKAPEGITQTQAETAQGARNSSAHIPVIEPDTKEYIMDFGGSILTQDTVPEINQLMEQYFLSISDCDMDTFLHLFTSQDTSEEQEFRDTFEKQRKYIESYQNISCYTAKGLEPDSYVVYVSYDVKFVGVDTLGPDLVRVYAVKGEDGQYRIYDQAVFPELETYLEHVSQNEDVRLLVSQVDQKITEAMEADEELKLRVLYLKNGPDYMQDNGQTAQGEPSGGEEPPGQGEPSGGEDPSGQEDPSGGGD